MPIPFDPEWASSTDYARAYRALGIQVVPSLMPAESQSWKRPALTSWRALEHGIISDAEFTRWYGEDGAYVSRQNMGIICGAASAGLFILDLDTQKGTLAQAWLDGYLNAHNNGDALIAPTQRTGGGGLQILMRAPPGWTPPTIKTPIGVDIRGQRGFAVLPPSKHESGKCYAWQPDMDPWTVAPPVCPQWLCAAIDALSKQHGGSAPRGEKTPTPEYATNAFGAIIDGREDLMTRIVWRAILGLYRTCSFLPGAQEQGEAITTAWTAYETSVKSRLVEPGTENGVLLEREGRGISLFMEKWNAAIRQWDDRVAEAAAHPAPGDDLPTAEALREAAAVPAQALPAFDPETGEVLPVVADPDFGAAKPDFYEVLSVRQVMNLPDPKWLIDKLIIDGGLSFIYGPPGCGKSFIALGMAAHVASNRKEWWARRIEVNGPVLYLTSEGLADMKYRLIAIRNHCNIAIEDTSLHFITSHVNFMRAEDVKKLVATVSDFVAAHDNVRPALVIVDTVSRSLPGADENSAEEMSLYVVACDAIREAFGCGVLGVHHIARSAGNMRGSTVLEGGADTLIAVAREAGEDVGTLTAKKIKAAADGWTINFRMQKVACGDLRGTESLVAELTDDNAKAGVRWPDGETCKAILEAMRSAWDAGKPWSQQPMSKYEGRYASAHFQRWSINNELADAMLEAWLIDGVIAFEENPSKHRGLRVIKDHKFVGRDPASYG